MDKLKLLFIITDRKSELKITESLRAYGVNTYNSVYGYGTARSELLEVLGIGEIERAIIITTVMESKLSDVYGILNTEYHFKEAGKGIAFTVPVTAVGGMATLKVLSGQGGNENVR